MRLPNATEAVVDIEKLRGYCLNPAHTEGRHKARLFRAILEITQHDAEVLHSALLKAALTYEAKAMLSDEFGQRYMLDFALEHKGNQAVVRSAWIVLSGEEVPRLITCYVLRERS